jgi:hypothetical protein
MMCGRQKISPISMWVSFGPSPSMESISKGTNFDEDAFMAFHRLHHDEDSIHIPTMNLDVGGM